MKIQKVKTLILPLVCLFFAASSEASLLSFWWPFPDTGQTTSLRKQAVTDTINSNASCSAIGDFYWEIGDATGKLASGAVGIWYGEGSSVKLASSSKLPLAAYLVQKFGTPDSERAKYLTMRSGYRSFNDAACLLTTTVSGCENLIGNNTFTASAADYFAYSGAHMQKLGVDIGLGSYTASKLTTDVRSLLGSDTEFSYYSPALAGGMKTTARGYAAFLRKIMNNKLAISSLMTANRTCTLPANCPQSISSPVPQDWDYGLGHWIERDEFGQDEAYSSVGLYGFYPWISADMQLYGIISQDSPLAIATNNIECGQAMRHAWQTATVQN